MRRVRRRDAWPRNVESSLVELLLSKRSREGFHFVADAGRRWIPRSADSRFDEFVLRLSERMSDFEVWRP